MFNLLPTLGDIRNLNQTQLLIAKFNFKSATLLIVKIILMQIFSHAKSTCTLSAVITHSILSSQCIWLVLCQGGPLSP